MANFDLAWQYLQVDEGGSIFTDIPQDHGGATKFGITLNTYTAWCAKMGNLPPSVNDLKNMTEATAKVVAQDFFWDLIRGDEIKNQSVANALLDASFEGVSRASLFAQSASGVAQDGVIGPITLAAINSMDFRLFLSKFIPEYQNFFINCVLNDQTQIIFLKGWLNRCERMLSLMI